MVDSKLAPRVSGDGPAGLARRGAGTCSQAGATWAGCPSGGDRALLRVAGQAPAAPTVGRAAQRRPGRWIAVVTARASSRVQRAGRRWSVKLVVTAPAAARVFVWSPAAAVIPVRLARLRPRQACQKQEHPVPWRKDHADDLFSPLAPKCASAAIRHRKMVLRPCKGQGLLRPALYRGPAPFARLSPELTRRLFLIYRLRKRR